MMSNSQVASERNGNASSASHGEPDTRRLTQLSSPRPSQPPAALERGAEPEHTPLERAILSARRNWLLLLICVLVVPVAALTYSLLQTKEYTSSASVLFTDDVSETDAERLAATNLQLGSLEQIAAQTAAALPGSRYSATEISDKVEASAVGLADVIKISATDHEPETAAQIANTFAAQFVVFRRNSSKERILKSQELVEAQLESLDPSEQESPEGEALAQRAGQLSVKAAAETGDAQVVQTATVPDSPSSPKTSLNVALGLLLGIVLGIGVSLLRDLLDRRLKEPEEVEETFRLPILATIPQSQSINERGIRAEPVGQDREAFGMLRASLQYFLLEPAINTNTHAPIKSILVTSPSSQDGKTTISWNLAVAEARSGNRVLYLEADLRQPNLASDLGLRREEDSGLSLVLAGALEPQSAIREVQGVDLIPAGPLPPNPAELIDSQRMGDLLEWAKEHYDRVVIDTPPTVLVADAVPLTPQVDGVVVVVRLRHSRRDMAEQLRDQLAHTESTTIGVVVNGVARRPDDGYYHRGAESNESFSRAYKRLSRGDKKSSSQAGDRQGV